MGRDKYANTGLIKYMLDSIYDKDECDDTDALAHELCDKYKTLTALFGAAGNDLAQLAHMPPEFPDVLTAARSCFLKAIYEREAPGCTLDAAHRVKRHCRRYFLFTESERMWALFLDESKRLVCSDIIGRGDPAAVNVRAYDLMELIGQKNCPFMIVAHNHPKATCGPSEEDIKYTEALFKCAAMNGTTLIDHIIVGADGSFSMWENGIMQNLWREYVQTPV